MARGVQTCCRREGKGIGWDGIASGKITGGFGSRQVGDRHGAQCFRCRPAAELSRSERRQWRTEAASTASPNRAQAASHHDRQPASRAGQVHPERQVVLASDPGPGHALGRHPARLVAAIRVQAGQSGYCRGGQGRDCPARGRWGRDDHRDRKAGRFDGQCAGGRERQRCQERIGLFPPRRRAAVDQAGLQRGPVSRRARWAKEGSGSRCSARNPTPTTTP